MSDFTVAGLSDRQHGMLVYVRELTVSPGDVLHEDIEAMRKNGFTDEDILDINLITSYFCFVNRIVLGLGVESTVAEAGGYRY